MSYGVLFVDDDLAQRKLIEKVLRDSEDIFYIKPFSHFDPKPTNQTFEREYGWYRQFDKTNKRKNFTQK